LREGLTFAQAIIEFIKDLEFKGSLPGNIKIMNPFRENPIVLPLVKQFYNKFYNDRKQRHLILGINPGRFGAGTTGIPFTDTKRLSEKCGLSAEGVKTFEPSSAFIYEMIDAYGGPEKFYSDYYISALSPLGFTAPGKSGKHINYNYYDSRELTDAIYKLMKDSLEEQLQFGIIKDVCFCLGTGKNYKFLLELNKKFTYFEDIVALEHPRFIMQYKTKQKEAYIAKYIREFRKIAITTI
jgi:hypothetical protein